MSNVKKSIAVLITSLALVGLSTPAEARVVQISKPKVSKVEKWGKARANTLKRAEPYHFTHTKKGKNPRRLAVVLWSGAEYVVTPCKSEDSKNCFWWASTRGNGAGEAFVNIKGKTHRLY